MTSNILCIGAALWDILGRCEFPMRLGNDKAGRIERIPGGVALNIAKTLARFGHQPIVLSVRGDDHAGRDLVESCRALNVDMSHVLVDPDLKTDLYMAIESQGNLIAAIADAHSLEQAGTRILEPLRNGDLASEAAPWTGAAVLDGNLTDALLETIATSALLAKADLRIAPASPGKAERLRHFLGRDGVTLYVNLEEAGLLTGQLTQDARRGAEALLEAGARRVLVTDGDRLAVDASAERVLSALPPKVTAQRVTGAGDTFLAAHLSAELSGAAPQDALDKALAIAAAFVAGEDH